MSCRFEFVIDELGKRVLFICLLPLADCRGSTTCEAWTVARAVEGRKLKRKTAAVEMNYINYLAARRKYEQFVVLCMLPVVAISLMDSRWNRLDKKTGLIRNGNNSKHCTPTTYSPTTTTQKKKLSFLSFFLVSFSLSEGSNGTVTVGVFDLQAPVHNSHLAATFFSPLLPQHEDESRAHQDDWKKFLVDEYQPTRKTRIPFSDLFFFKRRSHRQHTGASATEQFEWRYKYNTKQIGPKKRDRLYLVFFSKIPHHSRRSRACSMDPRKAFFYNNISRRSYDISGNKRCGH